MTSLPARNLTRSTAVASVGALILTTLALTGATTSAAEPPNRWGPRVTLSGTPVLGSPDVAPGPHGGINVAWGGDGDVRFRRMPPSSPWLGERSLGAGGSPRVGVDGKGNVTAVWFRQRRLMITEVVTARRRIGGTWSTPRTISRTGEDEQDGTGVRDPDLSVSPGGAVVAAWTWGSDEGGPLQRVQAAYRPSGGAWQGPRDITTPAQCGGQAATAIGPGGNAVVVCRGTDGVIRAVRHLSSGWTRPQAVSAADNARPDVATGPTGGTVAVWEHHTFASDEPPTVEDLTVKASRLVTGGVWTKPQQLSPSGATSIGPLVAVDGAHTATVVWRVVVAREGEPEQVRLDSARRSRGRTTAFGAPTTIAPFGDRVSAVALATASAGDVIVGWIRVGTDKPCLEAATRPRRHGWTAPVGLSGAAGVAGDETTPAVAMDRCGRGIVAWHDTRVRIRRMAACAS